MGYDQELADRIRELLAGVVSPAFSGQSFGG